MARAVRRFLRAAPNDRSGDDIRRQLVLDEGDAVAQLQLALLQALHLVDVGTGRGLQRRNRGVEVAMLLLQARQLRPKLAFFLFRHRRLGRASARASDRKCLWIIAFWLISDKPAGAAVHSGIFTATETE